MSHPRGAACMRPLFAVPIALAAASCQSSVEGPGASEASLEAREVLRGVTRTLRGTYAEFLDDYAAAGIAATDDPPVFVYPRLTSPYLARVEDGSPQLVPVVLHTRAFDGARFDDLSFWLVERSPVGPVERGARIEERRGERPEDGRAGGAAPGVWPARVVHWPERMPPHLEETTGVVLRVDGDVRGRLCDVRVLPVARRGPSDRRERLAGSLRLVVEHPPTSIRTSPFRPVIDGLARGDWFEALELLRHLSPGGRPDEAGLEDLSEIAIVLRGIGVPAFEDVTGELADLLEDAAGDGWDHRAYESFLARFERFVRSPVNPAPVRLEGSQPGEVFSFVVAADTQIHRKLELLSAFFDTVIATRSGDELDEVLERSLTRAQIDAIEEELSKTPFGDGVTVRNHLRDAKFLVLAGDLADGASGTAPLLVGTSVLGLLPPFSPYTKEFRVVRRQLRDLPIPVFAVPGNHDGHTGYGGVLNWPLDAGRWIFRRMGCDTVADGFHGLGDWTPALVRMSFLGACPAPRYDGLVEWQYFLGPPDFAFSYDGYGFVGLNTFDMERRHRATPGGVPFNVGGGVSDEDVDWFRCMLAHLGREPRGAGPRDPRSQFVFMHHDPRAAQPSKGGPSEVRFGLYDDLDSPVGAATMGYLGIGYSPTIGLYVPLLTPIAEFLYRAAIGSPGGLGQEWHRKWFWCDDPYGGRSLIEAINLWLDVEPGRAPVRHVFLAHNNVPTWSDWIRDERWRYLFRVPNDDAYRQSGQWSGILKHLALPFVTIRPTEPPEWARSMRVSGKGNARVIRLDDVSDDFFNNQHGFHLVVVNPAANLGDQVRIVRVELPQSTGFFD
ncbi:MAG: metallophosphoesterase [Planctomycetota bacterium JB042]